MKTYLLGYNFKEDKVREYSKQEIKNLEYDDFLLVKGKTLQQAIDNYDFCWELREKDQEAYDKDVNAKEFWND